MVKKQINMKKHTIIITEQQADSLQDIFNDPLLDKVGQTFSVNTLKTMYWQNASELMFYCDYCNLLCLGEGANRKVYQIDDQHVLKVEKYLSNNSQNAREVDIFRHCNQEEKNFLPQIYDWDKNHTQPLWIISEQVLSNICRLPQIVRLRFRLLYFISRYNTNETGYGNLFQISGKNN